MAVIVLRLRAALVPAQSTVAVPLAQRLGFKQLLPGQPRTTAQIAPEALRQILHKSVEMGYPLDSGDPKM